MEFGRVRVHMLLVLVKWWRKLALSEELLLSPPQPSITLYGRTVSHCTSTDNKPSRILNSIALGSNFCIKK